LNKNLRDKTPKTFSNGWKVSKKMAKKAVVTGGAGFIGSHITEELIGRDYRVTILDNLSTGSLANIEPFLSNKNTEFIQGSITNLATLRNAFSGADYVFHQAAVPSVPRSIKNPKTTHNINATGTLNVLLAARDTGVKKVVYASSSSVYGDTPTLPKVEDMTPNPISPYAISKLTAEYYCQVFQKIYGLKTASLRYFNVFGPRQNPYSQYAAVIPLFITMSLEGKSPVIFGDGEQSRDFTFVKDVAEANILAAESEASGIYNIGNYRSVTIKDLAQLIIKMVGNQSVKPIYKEPRPGDILHSLADNSRAKSFGFRTRYSLEEGLAEVIKYLKKMKLSE
jgi:UDP-glucose 4-epimerase